VRLLGVRLLRSHVAVLSELTALADLVRVFDVSVQFGARPWGWAQVSDQRLRVLTRVVEGVLAQGDSFLVEDLGRRVLDSVEPLVRTLFAFQFEDGDGSLELTQSRPQGH